MIEDYVLTPRIIGGELELHPMLVFIALIIAGDLFSLLGLVLAIPVLAVIKVLIRFLDELYLRSDFFLVAGPPVCWTERPLPRSAQWRPLSQQPRRRLTLSELSRRANRRRLQSHQRGNLIRNLLVSEKNRTFLNMPRAGGNGHEGQPQESFRDHLCNFQAVKFLRSHVARRPA